LVGEDLPLITRQALSCLSPKEGESPRLRFGIDGQRNLKTIGEPFRDSKEHICQIEQKALRELRPADYHHELRYFIA